MGVKLWLLAYSVTGYVLQISVDAYKQNNVVKHRLSSWVVMELTKDLEGKFHRVIMDNFYSGVELFVDLFIWECTLRELWGVSKNIFLLIQLIQNDQAFTESE